MPSASLASVLPQSTSEQHLCPVCGDARLRCKFTVPLLDGPFRNSRELKLRNIYECGTCSHLAAELGDPLQYTEYYASLSNDYHRSHDLDGSRYENVLELFPKEGVRRVLDIGCGTGAFLGTLPAGIERFGIEPAIAAASEAKERGIRIIQYSDLSTPEFRNSFDVVTAIDVVEHTIDLRELRRHLGDALRRDGILIILTGNAASPAARLLGRYWSYLNFAEHTMCFSPQSIMSWLQPDFSGIRLSTADHHPLRGREYLSLIRMWAFFPLKWILQKLFPKPLNMYTALSLPKDHMIVRAVRT